jgi:hypothetical protein
MALIENELAEMDSGLNGVPLAKLDWPATFSINPKFVRP